MACWDGPGARRTLETVRPEPPWGYFAEAIVNPNAVIEKGKGYAAPDGSSKMPSFNDSMTVQEAVDLVAYLKSLKPPVGGGRGA
jgi:cytochrome c1